MDFMAPPTTRLLPRLLSPALERAVEEFPVTVVTGARQTGKSTLVREVVDLGERRYVTLDDFDVRTRAAEAPAALLRGQEALTLDEVQREPNLLHAVKRSVDEKREPGRFVLTGSANLLLMEKVSETLAGRAVYLTLRPLTRRERHGEGTSGRWNLLLDREPGEWQEALAEIDPAPEPWEEVARTGGYPPVVRHHRSAETRARWFDGYVQTYLERDVQSLRSIQNLPEFRRLMRATCLRAGQLLNQTELGRDVGLPQPTVRRYLNLLETSYQLVRLEPFSVNRTKRLIKSPKAYWSDTGLACHLAGGGVPDGALFENLVLTDLLAWRDAGTDRIEVLYWRTASQQEVDFVIEASGRVVPIEVKASDRIRPSDARHLLAFLEEYPDLAPAAVLLYTGDVVEWIADEVLAIPWWYIF